MGCDVGGDGRQVFATVGSYVMTGLAAATGHICNQIREQVLTLSRLGSPSFPRQFD